MIRFLGYIRYWFHYLLPKKLLTVAAGCLANVKDREIKNTLIRLFIRMFNVNMAEACLEKPEDYASFNAFFIRHLKPACRPIATADIISPVDGYVSEVGRIESGQLLQAKGKYYTVQQLLACGKSQAKLFNKGHFATLYLSPADYHRIHMPITGQLQSMTYVPGKLFSVQPAATTFIPNLFAINERLVVYFETDVGLMAMVLVGATIVGAIATSWHGELKRRSKQRHFSYTEGDGIETLLKQAKEMGYFKLGSTVILLFAEGKDIQWEPEIKAAAKIKFGQALAHVGSGLSHRKL